MGCVRRQERKGMNKVKTAKNNRKRLPVGVENFKEIRSDRFYYVDKTGLIRELLDRWGKVNLFTRPRRFGKTLNMSMFQNFFEIGCDKSLFDGLQIADDAELCEKYMGKYPVISISLKSVEADTYEEARQMAVRVINEEARRFRYLLDSDQLFQDEKDLYSALLKKEISTDALVCSLRELSELLRKHHGKDVIILIDEYDVPLAKAEQQGYYDEMLLLIRGMLQQALKTNRNLHFAVLTGCLRVSKERIFTGLNNLRVLSVTNVRFDEYFGFTDAEVKELLEYYDLSEKYDTVREWYDGYRFGNEKVYCPWDVISYCDDLMADPLAEPKAYWSNTSSNEVVRRLLDKARPDTRDDIERLIAGETVVKEICEELTYRELCEKADNVWSVLFSTGYLTQQERATGNMFPLVIPNRESRAWME